MEKPPDDYLNFLPLWIRIRNLPVNIYTEETITEIGVTVEQVVEVAFDPDLKVNSM